MRLQLRHGIKESLRRAEKQICVFSFLHLSFDFLHFKLTQTLLNNISQHGESTLTILSTAHTHPMLFHRTFSPSLSTPRLHLPLPLSFRLRIESLMVLLSSLLLLPTRLKLAKNQTLLSNIFVRLLKLHLGFPTKLLSLFLPSRMEIGELMEEYRRM